MKTSKTLGLGVMAAIAAMALPASPASAKVCTNDANHKSATVCSAAHGNEVKANTAGTARLQAGSNEVLTVTNTEGGSIRTFTCTSSTLGMTIQPTGSASITSLTGSSCSSSGCTDVTVSSPTVAGKAFPWAATATTGTAPNGTLDIQNVSLKASGTCFFISVTCEWSGPLAASAITGGPPAIIHVNNKLHLTAGPTATCGTYLDWIGTYEVTTPTSLYLT